MRHSAVAPDRFVAFRETSQFEASGRDGAFLILLAALSICGCGHSDSAPGVQAAEPAPGTKAVTVQTAVPQRRDLSVKFEQPGSVRAYEEAELYAKVTGYVNDVRADIGDEVRANATLLTLDVPELQEDLAYKQALVRQAQAEREQADATVQTAEAALSAWESQLAQAQADLKKAAAERDFRQQQARRYSELAANNAGTPEVAAEKRDQFVSAEFAVDSATARIAAVRADRVTLLAKLAAAKADLKAKAARIDVSQADVARTQATLNFAQVRAPFSGVITQRAVDPGAFVNSAGSGRGEPLFTLCRMDKLIVVQRVPEKEAGLVRVGCKATLRIASPEPREVVGKVARFSQALDDKSRTMRVEIDIDNRDRNVYPGMYGPVTLILREIPGALTVPASAVYAVGGQTYVVQVQSNQARRIRVSTGYDDGRVVQVLSGLNGNEEIVVSNKGQLSEGQAVDPHRIDQRASVATTAQRP